MGLKIRILTVFIFVRVPHFSGGYNHCLRRTMLFKISKTSGNIPVIFACNSAFISLVFCCDRFYYNSNFSNLSSDIMYSTSNSLNYLPLHVKNISRQSHIIMSFLSNNYSQCKLMPNINVFVIF